MVGVKGLSSLGFGFRSSSVLREVSVCRSMVFFEGWF